MDNETRVIKMYLRTNWGVKQIALNLGLPKTYVGKIVNKINKSGAILYNNYISK